jgi:hypothetical protein
MSASQRRLLPFVVRFTIACLALAWAVAAMADEPGQEWFLYVRVCDADGCHSIALPVESCTAGGQAALAQWAADHPGLVVRAFTCLPGDPA